MTVKDGQYLVAVSSKCKSSNYTHLGVIDIKLKIPEAGLKPFNIEPALSVVYFDIF